MLIECKNTIARNKKLKAKKQQQQMAKKKIVGKKPISKPTKKGGK